MIIAHRIALDPTTKQVSAFVRACGVARFTYNWALAEWNSQYKAGEKPTANKLKIQWNAIKAVEFPWVYESPKGANQQPFTNLAKAFTRFFQKKSKYPRFKKKGQRDSFYVENDKLRLEGRAATLPKIGSVRLRETLRFTGKVMGAVVSRTANRWFLSVQVDVGDYARPRIAEGKVGADLGLKTFATLSTGEKIEAPKPLKAALKVLARAQRVISRRIKGSHRREKAKLQVSRLYARITSIRNDFLHKLTTRLCSENQAIGIEDLNVAGMVKNRSLSRAISDVGWGEFRRQLTYKAPIFGTKLDVVDRWFPSSKMCSACGIVRGKLDLSERNWTCINCGTTHDRDLNAAINLKITTLGLREINARGQESSGSETNETGLVEARTKPWADSHPLTN